MKNPTNRDIAALAGLQALCFIALTQLEPRFFAIHLYQLIPYIGILMFLAYHKERWAYMVGPMVSVAWLLLAYAAGLLDSAVIHLRTLEGLGISASAVAFLAITTAVIAVVMILRCRVHWMREFGGRGLARTTFLISFAIVAGYYAILLRWFWDMIPSA